MADPSISVQKAVYDALVAALESASPNLARVYDHVPQNTSFPYVVLESTEVVEDDYLVERKDDRFFYLSIWSRYPGQREVLAIIQAIDSVLHQQRLTLSVGSMLICTVIRKRTAKDQDGITYMGSVTLRIRTEH